MTSRVFQERLARRAKRAGVQVSPQLGEQLEAYFRLLSTWNQKINLTALNLTDLGPETVDRLLIEPLVAARHVPTTVEKMMDVGSGSGSPAIPMALALPSIHLLMVESKTRKSVFLREAIRAVGLASADVATARFEELLTRPEFHEAHHLVTIRAVRVEPRILTTLQAFLRPGGWMYLFRGPAPGALSETVTPPMTWSATYPLTEAHGSHLVVLQKRAAPALRRSAIT